MKTAPSRLSDTACFTTARADFAPTAAKPDVTMLTAKM